MPTRIYHWKHGWIPLTHSAALSKAHGSHAGAAKILSQMHPVPQEHLPRGSHVIAGHGGNGSFTLLDKKSGRTAQLSDAQASTLHGNGQTITGVDEHGNVTTTPASHGPAWQKVSAEDALGPDKRTPDQLKRDAFFAKHTRDVSIRERVVAKTKQAYRHRDGHTVLIETAMSKAKTQDFLDSVDHVVSGAGARDMHEPVRFHVAAGDSAFRSGRTLAYVRVGEHAVHVSPKLANGEAEQPKSSPHFMPAHDSMTTQRYALAHELGHVIDHKQGHTHGAKVTLARSSTQGSTAQQLFAEYRSQMSRYGATNPQEAYAEAYAQWHSGMSNPIADAYARKYGWTR